MTRKVNPKWHGFQTTPSRANALNIYLEIRQENGYYHVWTWEDKRIGSFQKYVQAESFAKNFRTSLMPTQPIDDVRFIPDPSFKVAKPVRNERVSMQKINATSNSFLPIQEDNVVVVTHPDDLIKF